jgi:NADH dehydrogenase [ubiquinone] 1 alpha subcomplex assembly factor 1
VPPNRSPPLTRAPAINFQGLDVPKKPFPLLSFDGPESLAGCKTMSDADAGAFSTARLDFVPARGGEPSHARFHGSVSLRLPRDPANAMRGAGYAGFRTADRRGTMFGGRFWNVDPYAYLALRVRADDGDGPAAAAAPPRPFLVNLQTDSIEPTDLHQHRLYMRPGAGWQTVLIPLDDFVRTNFGNVVEPESDMLRQRVASVGISLTDRVPGPFALRVERIWATNGLALEAEAEHEVARSIFSVGGAEERERPP